VGARDRLALRLQKLALDAAAADRGRPAKEGVADAARRFQRIGRRNEIFLLDADGESAVDVGAARAASRRPRASRPSLGDSRWHEDRLRLVPHRALPLRLVACFAEHVASRISTPFSSADPAADKRGAPSPY
jgi:hypothetical protein